MEVVIPTTSTTVEFASPPYHVAEALDVDHDDAPNRFRTINNVLGPATLPGFAPLEPDSEKLHFTMADEPSSFGNVEQQKCWRKLMLEEMNLIEDNDMQELTDLPTCYCPIGPKWAFKLKLDEHDAVAKHKMLIVAKGYRGLTSRRSLSLSRAWNRYGSYSRRWRKKDMRSSTWKSSRRSPTATSRKKRTSSRRAPPLENSSTVALRISSRTFSRSHWVRQAP